MFYEQSHTPFFFQKGPSPGWSHKPTGRRLTSAGQGTRDEGVQAEGIPAVGPPAGQTAGTGPAPGPAEPHSRSPRPKVPPRCGALPRRVPHRSRGGQGRPRTPHPAPPAPSSAQPRGPGQGHHGESGGRWAAGQTPGTLSRVWAPAGEREISGNNHESLSPTLCRHVHLLPLE